MATTTIFIVGQKGICFYCGEKAEYQLKNGRWCCRKSSNQCKTNREKNSKKHIDVHKLGIGYKFTNSDRKKSNKHRIDNAVKRIFMNDSTCSTEIVKKYFIEYFKIEYSCAICKIASWNSKELCLELDHINGNKFDNRLENLRLLCPNCHSQTHGWRGRNINKGNEKVSEEQLWGVLKESKNIRQALIKVGLTPKGANYNRVYQLIDKKKEA